MTKVDMEFRLARPLDERLLRSIAAAHAVYGLQRLRLADSSGRLLVEYDASRLTPAQVEAALHRAGIPATRSD